VSVYEPEAPPRLGWQMAKRFALGGILIVALSATAVATAVLLEVHDAVNIIQRESVPIPGVQSVLNDVAPGEPQTILVLGSDRRYGEGKDVPVRSDTIIVVRLDPDKGATAIMSLPRDLKVEIPGVGTDKINAAYAAGGPKLTVRTVRELLGIRINHVINVNFGGFRRAVNRIGCVYADIDRRYFNDNDPPTASAEGYATIDLKPGYQRLCGRGALDYVRFRHLDNDFVRASRQQEFLRQAKDQIGLGKVFGDRKQLLRIFGRYTQTDIAQRNDAAILRLIRLAYDSSKNPLTEIQFPAQLDGDFVDISIPALQRTVDRFIDVRGEPKKDASAKLKPKKVRRKSKLAPGLVLRKQQGEDHVLDIDTKLPRSLPVYFPKAILSRGGYDRDSPRSYTIRDRNRNRYKAYRIVLAQGDDGQYYGVQGTTWRAAPILDNPSDQIRMRKRTYQRYFDGRKIRMIAWKTPTAAYWVSNTLTRNLTNRQMMDIARSLQRIGQ